MWSDHCRLIDACDTLLQVYTVSISELSSYVPRETLPVQLGGDQEHCHKVWLQFCYQCATNQQPDPNSYFITYSSCSTTGRGSISRSVSTDSNNHISDFDSESSKDTVNEKHTNEDREKEKEDMDDLSEKEDVGTNYVSAKDVDEQGVVNRKRKTSDSHKNSCDLSAVNEFIADEMPRKKRPLSSGSNILDDSIHMPDSAGMTIQELLTKVNSLKRKGLFSEYASIKMEAPSGTFNISK